MSNYTLPVLIDMAIAVERASEDFYKALSSKFSEHKILFRKLARDESGHAEKYNYLLSRLDVMTYSTEETRMQADESIKILEKIGIVDNLRQGTKRSEEVSGLESAIQAAIQLEKDTLLFYLNLVMEFGDEEKGEILKILREEHSHLFKVNRIMRGI
jgi:rubrerythrin